MLPMFEPKKTVSLIMSKRKGKDGFSHEANETGGDLDPGLLAASEDFLAAVERKSPHDMAKAFKAAFDCLEAMPHEKAGESEGSEPFVAAP